MARLDRVKVDKRKKACRAHLRSSTWLDYAIMAEAFWDFPSQLPPEPSKRVLAPYTARQGQKRSPARGGLEGLVGQRDRRQLGGEIEAVCVADGGVPRRFRAGLYWDAIVLPSSEIGGSHLGNFGSK